MPNSKTVRRLLRRSTATDREPLPRTSDRSSDPLDRLASRVRELEERRQRGTVPPVRSGGVRPA